MKNGNFNETTATGSQPNVSLIHQVSLKIVAN